MNELAIHPTVKPVAMIADAMKDVSRRNDIILDIFGGSGSTLVAAHKTGRRGFLVELDPIYCDCIVRRWETYAKDDAFLVRSGKSFAEISVESSQKAFPDNQADVADLGSIGKTITDPKLPLSVPSTTILESNSHVSV